MDEKELVDEARRVIADNIGKIAELFKSGRFSSLNIIEDEDGITLKIVYLKKG